MIIYFAGNNKAAINDEYNDYYKHILQSHFDPTEDVIKFALRRRRRERREERLKNSNRNKTNSTNLEENDDES